MNYLAHLLLSDGTPESLVGNMMGDFVKGDLAGRFSPGIRRGIERHRKIDSFAAGNPCFIASKRRLESSYRHYKGILVDMYYDHFLASDWEIYSSQPLAEFIHTAYATLEEFRAVLPDDLQKILPVMFTGNWLLSYRDLAGIADVLKRMSARLRRANPLSSGIDELVRHYVPLREDFHAFFPQLIVYVDSFNSQPVHDRSQNS